MDAITMLRADHQEVKRLFRRFENAGDNAETTKRDLVERIIEALSVHAAVEEQMFYPAIRATVPGCEDVVLESLEEHHIVKWVLSELESMAPTDERFDAKVTVLIENVRHHIDEEEGDLFPKVRDELGRKALQELGNAMAEVRQSAPTHPHPRSPDEPPSNVVTSAVAGAVDRVGDNLSGLAQGSVSVVQDLIARLLDLRRSASRPTGSTAARSTARSVRKAGTAAADAVAEVGSAASGTAKRTARTTTASTKPRPRRKPTPSKKTGTAARGTAKSTGRKASSGAAKSTRTAKKS